MSQNLILNVEAMVGQDPEGWKFIVRLRRPDGQTMIRGPYGPYSLEQEAKDMLEVFLKDLRDETEKHLGEYGKIVVADTEPCRCPSCATPRAPHETLH